MRFEGDYLIPADPEAVWNGLNDPEVLRRSISGCTSMEQTGDTEYTATVIVRVGPVSATFKGKIELVDLNPPVSYTIRGRGQGGPAGFAKGQAQVSLAGEAGKTRLKYVADVDVGGKLASVGGRLIQGVARKNADDFFGNFSRVLTGERPVGELSPTTRSANGATTVAPGIVAASGHIPLIDRAAWLVVGIFLGFLASQLI